MDRHVRTEALLALLRSRQYATMGELAATLEVSVRTIRRDVERLRERGIDIEAERGRGGGVAISPHAPLPPIRLEESEAVGLWLVAQAGQRISGLPFSRASRTALDKVIAALPDDRRRELRSFVRRIIVAAPASATVSASVGELSPGLLPVFERAFSQRRCLRIHYADRHGNRTTRTIEPHGILVQNPVWYVLAVDTDRGAERMFRMDRIARATAVDEPFLPSLDVVAALTVGVPGVGGAP